MDSMRRNAQKMMPHVMALNKKPTMGMKNDRQPAPAVSKLVAYAKGGKVMAKGGAADKKQDKSMLARHNRLMHPGQKSKLMNGGMVKKYAGSGKAVLTAKDFKNKYSPDELAKTTSELNERDRMSAANKAAKESSERVQKEIDAEPKEPESITVTGKRLLSPFGEAFKAAREKQGAGGIFTFNGKKYSTNKADDKNSNLKMKTGGKVKGDKKKVMGTVGEAKALMAALQKARRPATPMPGTRMAGLGMAPPMAPPMKHGGKVMKKSGSKLNKKSPMPNKIKMMLYGKRG